MRQMAAVATAVLLVGCQAGSEAGQAALSPAGQQALARIEAVAAQARQAAKSGLSFESPSLQRVASPDGGGEQFRLQGILRNGSTSPVAVVTVVASYMDAEGRTVGGHTTQHFFEPAVAPGQTRQVVVTAPMLGGAADQSTSVLLEPAVPSSVGEPVDGWKPLAGPASSTSMEQR